MKNDQIILSLLHDLTSEVREIRQKDIPALQMAQVAQEQKAKDEAKFHARLYASAYGAITLIIAAASVVVAYWRH